MRAGLVVGATLVIVAIALGSGGLRASAAGATTPTPPTPSDSTDAPRTAAAPTISSPAPGSLITTATVAVSGTRDPGDEIQVFSSSGGGGEPACVIAPSADANWTCASVPLSSGPGQSIRALVTSDASRAASVTVDALTPPTITGPSPSNGLVSGIGGFPDATVTATTTGGQSCIVKADSGGAWACFLSLPSGSYTVSATQSASFAASPSSASAPVPLVIDAVAPAAPVLSSPLSGTTVTVGGSLTFSGTGENAATVNVYAATKIAGSFLACSATVSGGTWSCLSMSLPVGVYTVSALQTDAVGNVSVASAPISLTFAATGGAASDALPPRGAQPPGADRVPSQTAPAPDPTATAAPAPSQMPIPGGVPGAAPGDPGERWLTTTPFTSTTPPSVAAEAFPGWLRALMLAIVALLLLAVPARLLASTTARARAARDGGARSRLFGRNRPLVHQDPAVTPPPRWLLGGAQLVAAATLVTLSSGIDGEEDYVRLLCAAAVAVAAANAAWALLGWWAGRYLAGGAASVVVAPRALLLITAAALLSRATGLEPALLFGLVLSVTAGEAASTVARGRLAAVQVTGLATLGVLAWMLSAALPAVAGPLSAFATETTNAVAVVAIGSAAISLVPVGRLAGRAIFSWSRLVWVGSSLVVGTVLFALLVPVNELWHAGSGAALIAGAGLGFAGISVAAWLWTRYIEPVR